MPGQRDRYGRAVVFRGVRMRRFAARCAAAAAVDCWLRGRGSRWPRPGIGQGVLSVPGAGAVRIVRDEYGMPHVFASTARALFYVEDTPSPRTGCGSPNKPERQNR